MFLPFWPPISVSGGVVVVGETVVTDCLVVVHGSPSGTDPGGTADDADGPPGPPMPCRVLDLTRTAAIAGYDPHGKQLFAIESAVPLGVDDADQAIDWTANAAGLFAVPIALRSTGAETPPDSKQSCWTTYAVRRD